MIASGALYIGIMSGTSADGIDVCLARFPRNRVELFAHCHLPYPAALRQQVLSVMKGADLEAASRLDVALADAYADAVREVLQAALISEREVRAIGCHGQTVLHRPEGDAPTSIQLGDPHRLALKTGIDVVSDFRRADMAAGGQGAPLAPAFHAAAFDDPDEPRVVVNIGGMANLTLLPAEPAPVTGFDSGPGNVLIDEWHHRHRSGSFDDGGKWAASGKVSDALLARLREDPYFSAPPPKSTGREHFSGAWLDRMLGETDLSPADVQATLTELTACTIADAAQVHLPRAERVLVCGGGAWNVTLMERLRANLRGIAVETTEAYGLAPDQVEATAFAWLARQRVLRRPGNLPAVTGATRPVALGSIVAALR